MFIKGAPQRDYTLIPLLVVHGRLLAHKSLRTTFNPVKTAPPLLSQQSLHLDQQPPLIRTPPRTVPAQLVDDREQRLVLLDGEVRDPLGRRDGRQDELVEHLVHALAHHRLVGAAVGGLAHHLGWGGRG
jgi:hypothetical protein